jgi:hypothetical protein
MKLASIRCVRFALYSLLFLGVFFSALWAVAALLLSPLSASMIAQAAAVAHGLLALAVLAQLLRKKGLKLALLFYGGSFAAILFAFFQLQPSNDRDWQSDVAVLPTARIDGDRVLVRNIRNFSYRSEFDYSPAYYDREFDLNKLTGVDLVSVYWMGPAIAHIFLSFSFSDGQHLAISIETRKEKGEAYSTLKGFFRQYELYYVVADERDVIGLRTNYRNAPPEDVYIYRLKGPIENTRRLFLEYMRQLNALEAQPAFYNSLTTNCTTTIWLNSRVNKAHMPLHWTLMATGYLPELMYDRGHLDDKGIPFAELQQQAHANPRARINGITPDFSTVIRPPLPEHSSPR